MIDKHQQSNMETIKNLTLTAITLVTMFAVLGSCSSQEELKINNGSAIDFRAAVEKDSRASETTTANLSAFSVTAINADGSTYFNDTYSRQEQSWIPVAQHYWPIDNSELKFYAYAPASSSLTGTFDITGAEQKVTGFRPHSQLKDQKDLIVAYASGRKSTHGASGVQLTFKHALSQIEIRAKNAGAIYNYKVTGVRIGSIVSIADYAFPTSVGATGAWSLGSDKDDYVVEYATSPLILTSEAKSLMTDESGTAMLIPQQLTAWDIENDKSNTAKGAFLAVKINITAQYDNNQLYPTEDGGYAWACVPVGTLWQPGYKYIYTLDFSNGAGKFPPEDPDEPGEDILTDPIRFTVDVEPWITDDGNHSMNM